MSARQSPEKDAAFTPIRLCCGERHLGPVCPDSRVMCCLCFERFAQDDLAFDPVAESKLNVCQPCYDAEQTRPTSPVCGHPSGEVLFGRCSACGTRVTSPAVDAS